jgi:hypothetical protein
MKWFVFIMMVGNGGLSCDNSQCLPGQSKWVPFDNKEFASRQECLDYLHSAEWIALFDRTTPVYVECRTEEK